MTTVPTSGQGRATAGAQGINEVDARHVRDWLDRGEASLVDVRDPDERAREHIAGSLSHPVSRFDPAALPRGRVVFHCVSGTRSAEATARAAAAGRGDVHSLRGGIRAWKAAGLPVERGVKLPISVVRQVQVIVGVVVLACSVLAVTVSPWFIGGAALMGAGMLLSGASGTCAMAAVLSRMPWNAGFRGGPGCGPLG